MQTLFGVYCTDGVARSGESFSISALEDMVWQGAEGRPLGMSHDFHRFIGWNVITGLYMSHEMSYVVGNSYLPDDEDEWAQLQNLRKGYFYNHMDEVSTPYRNDFLNLLKERNVADVSAKWMYNGVLMYGYDGLTYKSFPSLSELCDDDGMIFIDDLLKEFDYLGQGVFAHKSSNLAILLHTYFRRSFSRFNNYNFGFLDLLFNVYQSGNKSVKVLLDPDFIGFAPSYKECHEFEYWYGPKYNDDIASIPEGLTRYENDNVSKVFNNVKSTEFIWKKKDGGKHYQFEMEEVVDADSPALPDNIFGCRYLHSFYDMENGVFNHFDGAIRCYNLEQMVERIDSAMDKMGHQSQYQKIFRMDGVISLSIWKSLITQYLSNNELVYDYFGIERPFSKLSDQKKVDKKSLIHSYVPYPMRQGDGVRVMVSYMYDRNEIKADREFLTVDTTTLLDGQKYCIADFNTIEVCKILNRVGATITLPKELVYYRCQDFNNYIPCIHHSGVNVFEAVNKTLEGIKTLIDAHVHNGDNDRYSFSLSWLIEDKTICIAFMGHVKDLQEWLQSFDSIPVERIGLKKWMECQNNFIHKHGLDSANPIYSDHIMPDGALMFKRHDIKEHVNIQSIEMINEGFKGSFTFEGNNPYLSKFLSEGLITCTPKFIVYDAEDLSNGESYLVSNNSAVLGETKYKLDCEMTGFNWAVEIRPINLLTKIYL